MCSSDLFDVNYGCFIWELDFENIASSKLWESQFKTFVLDSIYNYEKRITNISLNLEVHDIVKSESLSKVVTVRKRADIYINARLVSNDENSRLVYSLFLGLLSNE